MSELENDSIPEKEPIKLLIPNGDAAKADSSKPDTVNNGRNDANHGLDTEDNRADFPKNGIVDEKGQFIASDLKNLIVVSDPDLREMEKLSAGRYYYELLSEEDKKLYQEMLFIFSNMYSDIKLTTLSEESIDRVFSLLIDDVPELFFVDGYTFVRYTIKDELVAITLSGSYSMEKPQKEAYEKEIAHKVDIFMTDFNAEFPNGADDYHTIKFVYDYIIDNTEYVASAPENQNIISSLINHQSVCAGYARAFQYLTNKLGYQCALVEGFAKGRSSHAWNLIKADGYYYYVDVTFGDPSYAVEDVSKLPSVNYDYLLINDEEIFKNHEFRNHELMPACVAMEDNYYIKEQTYFISVDEELLKNAFNNAYDSQNEYVMLKMSNQEVYNEMWYYLINDSNIFKFLKNHNNSVSYIENPDSGYMIFWLRDN